MKGSTRSLAILISVFFFWGFIAASNTILLAMFKRNFDLAQWQSQLVDWAFYSAYAVGSLVYFLISFFRSDPLNKIGYKNGLVIGLMISAAGALLFIPAASANSFWLMLTALFVVGLGFSLQQIVANPYVIALGDPSTGAHRISLAGGLNSLGTMVGPLITSYAIYGSVSNTDALVDLAEVKLPYLILAIAFVAVAMMILFSNLPPIKKEEAIQRDLGALKYPQLMWGMFAIFIYVGVEVTIQSNLPALMESDDILGLPEDKTVHFVSLYWGSLMIGRWSQAISVFKPGKAMHRLLYFIVPVVAFGVVIGSSWIKGSPVEDLYPYASFILLLIGGFLLSREKPARTLILFSVMAMAMMLLGLFSQGETALYAFISGGLFCSIMWPCIFSLSLAGLGKYTTQGASLLVMMILGGGVIPIIQGALADQTGIQQSYIIPVVCFALLAFYGWRVTKILKHQGIDYDE